MQAEILRTASDFVYLHDEWDPLLERSGSRSIFLSHTWLSTWWKHFGDGCRPLTVIVREGSRLVAVAPLMVSRWEGFRHLGMIGCGTADYEDFIVDSSADRRAVLDLILEMLSVEFRGPINSAEVDAFFEAIIRYSTQRHGSAAGGYSLLENDRTADFYRSLAQELFRDGRLDLQALLLDHQIAAVQFNVADGDHYYYLLPAFDPSFSQYSVGRLLLVHLLEQCFDKQMAEFDLLFGSEPYKFDFATSTHRLMSLATFAPTARGKLAYWWFGPLRWRIRQSERARQLMPLLRRVGLLRRVS